MPHLLPQTKSFTCTGIHPLLLFPKAQSFCAIFPCEFLLTCGFNNHLYENSSQICLLISFCWDPHLHTQPLTRNLYLDVSHFTLLPIYLFFLYCFISENVAIYHIAHGRNIRAIPRPTLPNIAASSHRCY